VTAESLDAGARVVRAANAAIGQGSLQILTSQAIAAMTGDVQREDARNLSIGPRFARTRWRFCPAAAA
jgi:hypothetical protein